MPLANFLGSILASKDHTSLIIAGLQLVELLLVKAADVSQYLFRREGVWHEVEQLAVQPLITPVPPKDSANIIAQDAVTTEAAEAANATSDLASTVPTLASGSGNLPSGVTRALLANDNRASTSSAAASTDTQMKDLVTLRAKFMRDRYCASSASSALQATKDLKLIKDLASKLDRLSGLALTDPKAADLKNCLTAIANLFVNVDKAISSFEMLESGLVASLLKFLGSCKGSSCQCCLLSVSSYPAHLSTLR